MVPVHINIFHPASKAEKKIFDLMVETPEE